MTHEPKREYAVHVGKASWHQQRAGHVSAGLMVFDKRADAETYMRNVKKHHPSETVWIQERQVKP